MKNKTIHKNIQHFDENKIQIMLFKGPMLKPDEDIDYSRLLLAIDQHGNTVYTEERANHECAIC